MDSLAEYKILGCISFFSGFHFLASSESTENFCMVSVPGHMFEIYFYFGSCLQFPSTLSSSRIHRFLPAIIPVCVFISESSVDAGFFFFCSLFIYQCEIVSPLYCFNYIIFYSIFLETLLFSPCFWRAVLCSATFLGGVFSSKYFIIKSFFEPRCHFLM